MQINYKNSRIEKLFLDDEKLIKKVGLPLAKTIRKRYNELKAAPNWKIYKQTGLGKPHSLEGNNTSQGISITGNIRLVISLCCDTTDANLINECDVIEIGGVGDYHGEKVNWLIS